MIAQQNTVFTAKNQHSAECGTPPNVSNDEAHKYYGYFENEYGEQWMLIYDPKERRGILRGGDAAWEKEYLVTDGEARITMNPSEKAWLRACLKAADARSAASNRDDA